MITLTIILLQIAAALAVWGACALAEKAGQCARRAQPNFGGSEDREATAREPCVRREEDCARLVHNRRAGDGTVASGHFSL